MKLFLAVLTGSPDSPRQAEWDALSDEARFGRVAEGMQAWQDWMVRHADIIANTGGPLGPTKRVTEAGIADIRNNLAGFVVVRANSHEEAAALFINHPQFTIFPGDGAEIMEILPVPGA